MAANDIQAVREVLQLLQNGYNHRDKARLDEIRVLFADDPAVEVIGTGGLVLGDEEWPLGKEAALELVKNDWEGWGDVRFDVAGARIYSQGDVAWLATSGTVEMHLKQNEVYANYLSGLQATIADTERDARSRLLEVLRGASNTLFEGEKGDTSTSGRFVSPPCWCARMANGCFTRCNFRLPPPDFRMYGSYKLGSAGVVIGSAQPGDQFSVHLVSVGQIDLVLAHAAGRQQDETLGMTRMSM